jgi:hypothetical protein
LRDGNAADVVGLDGEHFHDCRREASREIAQVMLHDGEVVDTSQLEREAVRLRKRYQAAKQKLRALAVAEGLVREHD